MNKTFRIVLIIMLLIALISPLTVMAVKAYSGVPSFSIVSVAKNASVTIQTYNFPASDSFTVTMGPYGSQGIGGVVVGTTTSGSGGSFTATYSIPSSLSGSYRIAIRMQSPTTGYFAYNWFYNDTTGTSSTPASTPVPGYSGYPYFSIASVVRDASVTINASNFPKNETFKVLMGPYGTLGVGGTQVATQSTSGGGAFTATYNIPSSLAGSYQIAIRLESTTSGYYAYNWFYNNTAGTSGTPAPTATPGPTAIPGYSGYPYFKISAVTRDTSVTIQASNFPPNDSFTVMMGPYGSAGVGGYVVGTQNTAGGGSFSASYSVPAALAGSYQIAIRLQSSTTGYYAYNWFYNNTTP
jgi:hypothetical protein